MSKQQQLLEEYVLVLQRENMAKNKQRQTLYKEIQHLQQTNKLLQEELEQVKVISNTSVHMIDRQSAQHLPLTSQQQQQPKTSSHHILHDLQQQLQILKYEQQHLFQQNLSLITTLQSTNIHNTQLQKQNQQLKQQKQQLQKFRIALERISNSLHELQSERLQLMEANLTLVEENSYLKGVLAGVQQSCYRDGDYGNDSVKQRRQRFKSHNNKMIQYNTDALNNNNINYNNTLVPAIIVKSSYLMSNSFEKISQYQQQYQASTQNGGSKRKNKYKYISTSMKANNNKQGLIQRSGDRQHSQFMYDQQDYVQQQSRYNERNDESSYLMVMDERSLRVSYQLMEGKQLQVKRQDDKKQQQLVAIQQQHLRISNFDKVYQHQHNQQYQNLSSLRRSPPIQKHSNDKMNSDNKIDSDIKIDSNNKIDSDNKNDWSQSCDVVQQQLVSQPSQCIQRTINRSDDKINNHHSDSSDNNIVIEYNNKQLSIHRDVESNINNNKHMQLSQQQQHYHNKDMIQKLQIINSQLQHQLNQLQQYIKQLQQQNTTLYQQLSIKQQQYQQLTIKQQQYQQQLSLKQQPYQQSCEWYEQKIQQLTINYNVIVEHVDSLQQQIITYKNRIVQLQGIIKEFNYHSVCKNNKMKRVTRDNEMKRSNYHHQINNNHKSNNIQQQKRFSLNTNTNNNDRLLNNTMYNNSINSIRQSTRQRPLSTSSMKELPSSVKQIDDECNKENHIISINTNTHNNYSISNTNNNKRLSFQQHLINNSSNHNNNRNGNNKINATSYQPTYSNLNNHNYSLQLSYHNNNTSASKPQNKKKFNRTNHYYNNNNMNINNQLLSSSTLSLTKQHQPNNNCSTLITTQQQPHSPAQMQQIENRLQRRIQRIKQQNELLLQQLQLF